MQCVLLPSFNILVNVMGRQVLADKPRQQCSGVKACKSAELFIRKDLLKVSLNVASLHKNSYNQLIQRLQYGAIWVIKNDL